MNAARKQNKTPIGRSIAAKHKGTHLVIGCCFSERECTHCIAYSVAYRYRVYTQTQTQMWRHYSVSRVHILKHQTINFLLLMLSFYSYKQAFLLSMCTPKNGFQFDVNFRSVECYLTLSLSLSSLFVQLLCTVDPLNEKYAFLSLLIPSRRPFASLFFFYLLSVSAANTC